MHRATWLATALLVAFFAMAVGADAAVWKHRGPATPNDLDAVTCPSDTTCFAFGQAGAIVKTTNRGSTWTAQSSGFPGFLRGTCTSTSDCVAVGDAGGIVRTTNGGSTWTMQSSGTLANLRAVSCSGATCIAVGWHGTILRSTDGGATWTTRTSGTLRHLRAVTCSGDCIATGDLGTVLTSGDGGLTWTMQTSGTTQGLFGVTCASGCIAVGLAGTILRSTDGGVTWSQKASPTSSALRGVTCSGTCFAVGDAGAFVASRDGGSTWKTEPTDPAPNLESVTCGSSTMCLAVGDAGTVLSARFPSSISVSPASQSRGVGQAATVNATIRDQDGQTLSGVGVSFSRTGANPAPETTRTTDLSGTAAYSYTGTAQGSDTVTAAVADDGLSDSASVTWGPSPAYPSTACDTGTNVFQGYAGNAYVTLRTIPDPANPSGTWVCFAADNGTQHFGGRLAVTGTVSVPVASDDDHDSCDANPSSRVVNEPGAVGPVGFDLDANVFSSGHVWVCAMVNVPQQPPAPLFALGKRLRIETSVPSTVTFVQDSTSPYPFYVEKPAPGSASGTCQAAPNGKTRVMNAEVGTHHVWLYTWQQSTSRAHACARVEGPGASTGGRLTVDSNGTAPVGVQIEDTGDFSPCETNVLTLDAHSLSIKTHAGVAPAWLCVKAGSTNRRVKIDSSGGQGIATFTPDT